MVKCFKHERWSRLSSNRSGGKNIEYKSIDYIRTRKEGEKSGTLSIKPLKKRGLFLKNNRLTREDSHGRNKKLTSRNNSEIWYRQLVVAGGAL